MNHFDTEIIRSITENAKDSIGTIRYLDFLILPAKIAKADNWGDFSLQDLFLSVESLVRCYCNMINTFDFLPAKTLNTISGK